MNTCTILVWLTLSSALPLQFASSTTAPSTISVHGAFFALSVADISASAKWYSETFGLKVVMQLPKRVKYAVNILEGNGLIIELIQNEDAVPLTKAAPTIKDFTLVHGLFKVGIIVEDFEGALRMLKERKVEIAYGPYPAKENQKANVIIKDYEGNLIQVFGK